MYKGIGQIAMHIFRRIQRGYQWLFHRAAPTTPVNRSTVDEESTDNRTTADFVEELIFDAQGRVQELRLNFKQIPFSESDEQKKEHITKMGKTILSFPSIAEEFAQRTDREPIAIKIAEQPEIALIAASTPEQEEDEQLRVIQHEGQSDMTLVIGSNYLKDPNTGKKSGGPIADHLLFRQYENQEGGHVIIAYAADGSGWGEHSKQAAVVANTEASDAVETYLRENGGQNKQDLTRLMVEAVGAGHQAIMKSAIPRPATQVGVVGVVDAEGNFKGALTAVGDNSVFMRRSDGTFECISGDAKDNVTDVTDPGGQIGKERFTGLAEIRNFRVIFFEAKEGDTIFMGSDGIFDNQDPYFVGEVSPQAALETLLENGYRGAQTLKEEVDSLNNLEAWNRPAGWVFNSKSLATLKNLYQLYHLEKLDKEKEDGKTLSESLAEYACELYQNVQDAYDNGILGPNDRVPETSPQYPGKPDHLTCMEIQIKRHV